MRPLRLAAACLMLCAMAAPASGQVRFHGEASGANVKVMSWRDIPFRTVVRQQQDFSCGSAALATLLTYHYDRPTSEAQTFEAMFRVGDQAKIRQVGFSMLDMKRYLETRGVKADGFRMSLDEIAARNAPAIVLIDLGNYRHFVVVKGISKNEVLVGDPAAGLRTYSRKDFQKIWNGVVFMMHEDQGLGRPRFNAAAEWSPWAVAPVNAIKDGQGIGALTSELSPLYQITPYRDLEAITARGLQ